MVLQCRLWNPSKNPYTERARSSLRWPKDFELINGTQCLAKEKAANYSQKICWPDGISILNSVWTLFIKSLSSTHAWFFRFWFFACATTLEPLLLRLLSAAMPAMWGTSNRWNWNVRGCRAECHPSCSRDSEIYSSFGCGWHHLCSSFPLSIHYSFV